MLSSISPVGEASRRQRWGVTVAAHLFGSALGGSLVGATLGTWGRLVSAASWGRWTLVILGLAALAGATLDAGRPRTPLPSWQRQVDERWLDTYRGWVYGVGYGFQLGTGVMTIVPSALTHVAFLAAALTGSTRLGGVIGLTFGVVRAVPLALAGAAKTPHRLRSMHRRIDAARAPVTRAGVAAQFVLGAVAVLVAVVVPA